MSKAVVVSTKSTDVVTVVQGRSVVVGAREPFSVAVTRGVPGAQGPIGPAGGSALTRTAGTTTSALLAVWEGEDGAVWPLDSADGTHIYMLLGVTITAADAGQPINVQRLGAITDAAWSWTPGGRVYLGANGALTQTPPAGGFDVLIGVATSPIRLLLNIQDPIELE